MSATAGKGKRASKRGASGRVKSVGSTPSRKKTAPIRPRRGNLGCVSLILLFAVLCFLGYFFYGKNHAIGKVRYGVYIPNGYSIYGIDISHHQKEIEWEKLCKEEDPEYPIRFVIAKATEGSTYKDPTFESNRTEIRSRGMVFGAYHYFTPDSTCSATSQAELFIRTAGLTSGDFPPILDVEEFQEGDINFQKRVLEWLSLVERHYGVKPIIYTSVKFRHLHLTDARFSNYTLWLAHYHVRKPTSLFHWTVWQSSNKAELDGIPTKVDFNIFYAGENEFRSLLIPRTIHK